MLGAATICALCTLATTCERCVIEGTVEDVQGQALPGVAVSVEGTEWQALTDAMGRYTVRYRPGPVVLDFLKNGYTPGRIELDAPTARVVQAAPAVLWRLPVGKGVYLYDRDRYTPAYPIEPEHYSLGALGTVHGVKRIGEVTTPNPAPTIIAHGMPPYGMSLCRLKRAEVPVAIAEDQTQELPLWIPAARLALTVTPIDEPEGLLLHLGLPHPLDPGAYALHWGALDGQDAREMRAFVFSVAEDEAPGEEEAPAEPADGVETAG